MAYVHIHLWQVLVALAVCSACSAGLSFFLRHRRLRTGEVLPTTTTTVWPTQTIDYYWRKHYSVYGQIPSMECLPRYTPAGLDPAVESLHPNVARDILTVLDETMKEKSEEN